MPSTRKQKAREKRSRQSDVMSDIENLDVMLGSYQRENNEFRGENNENTLDQRSDEREGQDRNVEDYQTFLNNNPSENSCLTIETSRFISSEISSQMSRKFQEMQTSLNSQILDVINTANDTRELPSIKNAVRRQNSAKNTSLDGLHEDTAAPGNSQKDLRSNRLHPENTSKSYQDAQNEFPRLISIKNNQTNHRRENSGDSQVSDDEYGYDMVTGANLTPQMVPEFLTGRPMHSQNKTPHQQCVTDDTRDTTIPAQIPTVPTNNRDVPFEAPMDPINRLADVIMGINNKPSAQTLMVRPVNTTTLTFDGKSEKFELFEDLFHTMIKMQPDMTETMKINHFHSLLRKNALQTFRNINSAKRQTLEDILAIFRRKYVKPESQATAKHKWHKLVFDPNTMKLPDFLEELNQGAEKAFGEHAQAMIGSLLYAKLPPKLKRSVNMARLEIAAYEEIVTHLERELELNGLEEGDDILVPQCPQPRQQHDRVLASSHPALTQTLLAIIAKNLGTSKMTAANSKERRNNAAMKGRIPRKNIQNVQLAKNQIIRRNDVGKALELTSSPRTSNWTIPKQRKRLRVKMTLAILNPPPPFLKTQKTRVATTLL